MINTQQTIKEMPAKLRAFKKYIEKYECTYCDKGNEHALYFYKPRDGQYMPYVIVVYVPGESHHVVIYINYELEDLSKPDSPISRKNFATNDMKKFLEAIRECV